MVTKIDGEIFNDHRGQIVSLNNFDLEPVRRTYTIHHPDPSVIRGWHAHKHERKWFHCIKGSFTLMLVEVDCFENPSPNLKPEVFHLSEKESCVLCVPTGYANCIFATEADSILQVWSDVRFPEPAIHDSWRWPVEMWGGDKIADV
jgi:dTDP-4-dehydrorhamnose 3,5-epimerase